MDASELFSRSPTLQSVVEDHIMKLILGPGFKDNKMLSERHAEYKDGLLDDYNCFIFVPKMPNGA
jgi:hypothetical protein